MGIVITNDATAIGDRREFVNALGIMALPFAQRLAINPESGDAAIRMDVEAKNVTNFLRGGLLEDLTGQVEPEAEPRGAEVDSEDEFLVTKKMRRKREKENERRRRK